MIDDVAEVCFWGLLVALFVVFVVYQVLIHQAEQIVKKARRETGRIIMPELTIDDQGHLTDLKMDLGFMESGEVVHLALPVIHGLGVHRLHLTSNRGHSKMWDFDFETGRVEEIADPDTSEVPDAYHKAFDEP